MPSLPTQDPQTVEFYRQATSTEAIRDIPSAKSVGATRATRDVLKIVSANAYRPLDGDYASVTKPRAWDCTVLGAGLATVADVLAAYETEAAAMASGKTQEIATAWLNAVRAGFSREIETATRLKQNGLVEEKRKLDRTNPNAPGAFV